MSVEITFQPSGATGLVAEGTNISAAARRLGLDMPANCQKTGDCSDCVITVVQGNPLLSAPTPREHEILGAEGLDRGERLACQAAIERSGEVVLNIPEGESKAERQRKQKNRMRERFTQLPLPEKVLTLVQFERLTFVEAFNAAVEKPRAIGEKLFGKVLRKGEAEKDNQ